MSLQPSEISAAAAPASGGPQGQLKLNIGGIKFTTTYSTIHSVEGSMLSAMFSGRHALTPDAEGYHFVDRDGAQFHHVLNLLRYATEFKVDLPPPDLEKLEIELDFYGLIDAYERARTIIIPAITATSESCGHNNNTWGQENTVVSTVAGLQLHRRAKKEGVVVLIYPGDNKILSRSFPTDHASYVMIGCKGMPRGEALEAADDEDGLVTVTSHPQTVGYKW
ncbi:hypothetical protein B484DRAFT_398579 [Ochromonadaceae sp. CCMP2298]|nr:hypothetical protein B484DRAFT_398579 [Ochromonadaceae sp. CCMP2298]